MVASDAISCSGIGSQGIGEAFYNDYDLPTIPPRQLRFSGLIFAVGCWKWKAMRTNICATMMEPPFTILRLLRREVNWTISHFFLMVTAHGNYPKTFTHNHILRPYQNRFASAGLAAPARPASNIRPHVGGYRALPGFTPPDALFIEFTPEASAVHH